MTSAVRPLAAPLDRPIRLGVFVSGGGTTLANFLEQIDGGRLSAEIAIVIADKAECRGLERARERNLQALAVPRRDHADAEAFSAVVFEACRAAKVDLVVLSGFLSKVAIPPDFESRVLNIHPALIPAFCGQGYYGTRVHQAVLDRGAKISGCTVHFADNDYDHGPIVLQRCVSVEDGDTPHSLAARVFEAECEAYPEAVRLFASGRLEIEGRRVRLLAE